jgi:hypothetical protein
MRHTGASPHERDLVLTHVTGLQSRPVVIAVRSCVLMLVSGRSVTVLGMIVIGVRVHVPHGALPRDRQQGQPEQSGEDASHRSSLVELRDGLKAGEIRRGWLRLSCVTL